MGKLFNHAIKHSIHYSNKLSVGVVPGDPHPGDPRGKYFLGSPFPGEFLHGDPGEN